ncbi:MAG: flippase [Sphaerochaetaceae bacterium]|nr:flippase [Sphaerochaetaceae bacterium]
MSILRSFKNKQIKETYWAFLTKGLSVAFFLIINIILSRKLGVENFGLWSLFLSIITIIFTISFFGIGSSTKKFIAQYNKTDNLKSIFVSSIKLRFLFSFLFCLILFVIHKPLANILGYPELEKLLLYGIPLVFFSGLVEYLKDIFIGLHRIKYNFIINFLEFGFKLLLIIIFLLFSNIVISVITSFSLALFITSLVGLLLLYFNFYKPLKKTNKNFTKQILNYSYPLIFISLGFIIATEIDTFMIGLFTNTTEVGIYAVAKQIILKLPHISLAIAMGTMPIFAQMNESNKLEFKKKLYNLLKINSVIFLIIIVAIIALSPFLVPLIFGVEYVRSVLPLQILTVYLFGFATSILLSSFLDYIGKAKKRAINISISILLNLILNIILIPEYGVVGAAISTSVSYIPYVLLNWIEVKRSFD